MQGQADSNIKAFFLLAVRYRGDSAKRLFSSFAPDVAATLNEMHAGVDFRREDRVRDVARRELAKLGRTRQGSYLRDVHNEWLVEMLKWESPHVISLILRYLPADRVRAALELLPKHNLEHLPSLGKTFAVPAELVEAIRERFEGYFVYHRQPDPQRRFAFESVCFLGAKKLSRLFFELGYQEIAWGLTGLPDKTRAMILNRLLPEDRLRVEFYLEKSGAKAVSQRVRRAQVHLISKEIDQKRPRFFVKELGFLIHAKSILPNDLKDLEIIKQKLSLHEAMVLQRLTEKNLEKNNEATVLAYREDIMAAMKTVLGAG